MKAPLIVGCAVGFASLYLVAGWQFVALSMVTGALLVRFAVRPRRRPVRARRRRRVWSDEERRFILDRDGWRCVWCGSQDQLEIDHVIPFSKGGACSVENAAVLCRSCNARKGAT